MMDNVAEKVMALKLLTTEAFIAAIAMEQGGVLAIKEETLTRYMKHIGGIEGMLKIGKLLLVSKQDGVVTIRPVGVSKEAERVQ